MDTATQTSTEGNVDPAAAQAAIDAEKKKSEGQDPKDQQPEGSDGKDNDGSGSIDYSDPKQTEEVIKNLRAENAKSRTQNKELSSKVDGLSGTLAKLEGGLKKLFGGEEDDLTPEQKIDALTQQNQANESKTALLELAYEHEIPKSEADYFQFLIMKGMDGLKEGEEMSEEAIEEIAKKVKAKAAPASTSVGTGGSTGKAPEGKADSSGDISVDDFAAMNLGEKSKLYQDNPDLYQKLISAAKKEGKLV